jgi:hypothetical protein
MDIDSDPPISRPISAVAARSMHPRTLLPSPVTHVEYQTDRSGFGEVVTSNTEVLSCLRIHTTTSSL